jgi:hypothetical protein
MDALLLQLVDAIEAQIEALTALVATLRANLERRAEVEAAAKQAICQHPSIVRSTAMDRDDEFFCGECGVQLAQAKSE